MFDGCVGLTEIRLPLGITDIGNMNFTGLENLLNIYTPANHPNIISLSGILFDITGTKMLKFPMGRTGAYTVPDDVTSIDWAFEDSKLDELTISNAVELSTWGWNSFIAEANAGRGLKVRQWMKPLFQWFVPAAILFIYIYGMATFKWR